MGSKIMDDILGIDDTKFLGIKKKNAVNLVDKFIPDMGRSDLAKAQQGALKAKKDYEQATANIKNQTAPSTPTAPGSAIEPSSSPEVTVSNLLKKISNTKRKKTNVNRRSTMLASARNYTRPKRSEGDYITLGD